MKRAKSWLHVTRETASLKKPKIAQYKAAMLFWALEIHARAADF